MDTRANETTDLSIRSLERFKRMFSIFTQIPLHLRRDEASKLFETDDVEAGGFYEIQNQLNLTLKSSTYI